MHQVLVLIQYSETQRNNSDYSAWVTTIVTNRPQEVFCWGEVNQYLLVMCPLIIIFIFVILSSSSLYYLDGPSFVKWAWFPTKTCSVVGPKLSLFGPVYSCSVVTGGVPTLYPDPPSLLNKMKSNSLAFSRKKEFYIERTYLHFHQYIKSNHI